MNSNYEELIVNAGEQFLVKKFHPDAIEIILATIADDIFLLKINNPPIVYLSIVINEILKKNQPTKYDLTRVRNLFLNYLSLLQGNPLPDRVYGLLIIPKRI